MCGGTGYVIDQNSKGQKMVQCTRCAATFYIGEIEVKVEGVDSEEVKDVSSHLIRDIQKYRNLLIFIGIIRILR